MNDLLQYFESSDHRLIHKWLHYFEIYDRHFSRFRGTDVCIVEVGIYHGGSLQMWRSYFGPNAKIIGIDIDPRCKELEEEGIEIIIGNQEDREFLRSLKQKIPRIDILLDDGGHTMTQQIVTFEELFSQVNAEGIYLCEDLHTSYWGNYGGGFRKPSTFIEYSKNFIDSINAWHSRDPESFPIDHLTRSVYSVNFYTSVLVIEKKAMSAPCDRMAGSPSFDQDEVLSILHTKQTGEPLAYELHPNFTDEYSRYADLNSRFFKLLDEHQKLQSYTEDLKKFATQVQEDAHQTHLKAQEFYEQARQAHQALEQTQHHLHNVETGHKQQIEQQQQCIGQQQQQIEQQQQQIEQQQQQIEQHKVTITSEIAQLRYQLEVAQSQSLRLQNDLLHAEQNQEVQRFRVERLTHKLEQVRGTVKRLRDNRDQAQSALTDAQGEVEAMKTSKFWKLRGKWFKVKRLLGLKGVS